MFYSCNSLTSIPDISGWKTNKIKEGEGKFLSVRCLSCLNPQRFEDNSKKIIN